MPTCVTGRQAAMIVMVVFQPLLLHAHVGPLVFPVYEFPPGWLPDLQDGSVDDWEDVIPKASITFSDLVPVDAALYQATLDQSDLTVRCFLGWSYQEQKFYIAVERVDDVYVNTYPVPEDPRGVYVGMRGHDGVEFMVDGDHSGGGYIFDYLFDWGLPRSDLTLDQRKDLTGRQAQSYVALAQNPPGTPQILTSNAGNDWVTGTPYVEVGGTQYGEIPNYSLVEVGLTLWDELDRRGPEASTPSKLEPGAIIGFQMSIMDYDESAGVGYAEAMLTLDGSPWGQHSSDFFVDAQLIPCEASGCAPFDGTAVHGDSWGRIKASLR